MSAERARSEGPLGRAVREALRAVAADEQQGRVLSCAIELAGSARVPEDPERAREFVEGPLRVATAEVLGEHVADAVVEDLEPILQLASSQVRPKEPETAPLMPEPELPGVVGGLPSTAPPPGEEPVDAPLVLVATLDRSGLQRLARQLLHRATVRPVHDVFELMYALEANAGRRPLVVLDCCLPAVEPQSVASMLAGLAEAPRVLLWGAPRPVRANLEATAPAARDWIALGSEATDADVVALIESLL